MDGDLEVETVTAENLYVLKNVGDDGVARSLEDWGIFLNIKEGMHLCVKFVQLLREYPGGKKERDERRGDGLKTKMKQGSRQIVHRSLCLMLE